MLLIRCCHLKNGSRQVNFLLSISSRSNQAKLVSNFCPLIHSEQVSTTSTSSTSSKWHAQRRQKHFLTSTNATGIANNNNNDDNVEVEATEEEEEDKKRPDTLHLANREMRLPPHVGGGPPRVIKIRLQQSQTGHKYIQIARLLHNVEFINCPKILLATEAYPLVRAMDGLLEELATREGQELPENEGQHLLLHSSKSPGTFYDFRLDLVWQTRNGISNFVIQLCSQKTRAKPDHKEKNFVMSMKEFHWLRHRMDELLTEHDGSEQLNPAPPFPAWLTMDGLPGIARPITQGMPWINWPQQQAGQYQQMPGQFQGQFAVGQTEGNQPLAWKELNGPRHGGGGTGAEPLRIELSQNNSGTKYFQFRRVLGKGQFENFSEIVVPAQAYQFACAMDDLLAELASREGQKLPEDGAEQQRHLLYSTNEVPGTSYDFCMDLVWLNSSHSFAVDLRTRKTEANPDYRERRMELSVKEFHWLRHEMGKMLAKHADGSGQLMSPARLPGWLTLDGRPRPIEQQVPGQFPQFAEDTDSNWSSKSSEDDEAPDEDEAREEEGGKMLALRELGTPLFGGGGPQKLLIIRLSQGKSGIKMFDIARMFMEEQGLQRGFRRDFNNFEKILVPMEVYPFVRAMDELFEELVSKQGQNLPATGEHRHLLYSTKSSGKICDFCMDLIWLNASHSFAVDLRTRRTEAKPEHGEKMCKLSLKEFHWLRLEMGRLLAEHDGSEELNPAPRWPDWLTFDGRLRPIMLQMPGQQFPGQFAPTSPEWHQQQPMGRAQKMHQILEEVKQIRAELGEEEQPMVTEWSRVEDKEEMEQVQNELEEVPENGQTIVEEEDDIWKEFSNAAGRADDDDEKHGNKDKEEEPVKNEPKKEQQHIWKEFRVADEKK